MLRGHGSRNFTIHKPVYWNGIR